MATVQQVSSRGSLLIAARTLRSLFCRRSSHTSSVTDHPNTTSRYDVVLVGGGVMGSASAYFLSLRMPRKSVCVIERDLSYTRASSMRSLSSIRQQFSCPENISMSQFSIEFLKSAHQHLEVEGEDKVDVSFVEGGYLFLASEEGEAVMRENYSLQRELGVYVELLDPVELANKFPWLSTKGVSLASFGFRDEGWFDPWILLSGFKKKTISLGADYISAEVVGVNIENDSVKSVKIQNATEEKEIECNYLVNACGPWAAELALMAGIGKSDHTCHIMRTRLPVEPRLRSVFVFRCPTDLPNSPLVIAKNIYWRRESTGTFLAGYVPSKAVDKAADGVDLEAVDYKVFDEVLWPSLAEWVPAFEELKVQSGWSGYYEYNTLDQNAIIGTHPVVTNYVFANGFSGHGIQMAPGVGRAVSEIILDGNSHSIDLKNFSFQRVLDHEPYGEKLVV